MQAATLLEYQPANRRAPVAAFVLRGWAVTNWLGALAAAAVCSFLVYKWGWPMMSRDGFVVVIAILLGLCFFTTLSAWGLQCWWYGTSVLNRDTVSIRRARGITILLSVLWVAGLTFCCCIRFNYGAKFLQPAERIAWTILAAGTTTFLAAALLTIVLLTLTLRPAGVAR
jgi:hypothetical protein